jgi:Ca2+-binding EF-hand superfamily protein
MNYWTLGTKVKFIFMLGFIDSTGLVDSMKSLGYEIDKRQVTQMIEYLDEGNKGVISKDSFIKFMTGRLVSS